MHFQTIKRTQNLFYKKLYTIAANEILFRSIISNENCNISTDLNNFKKKISAALIVEYHRCNISTTNNIIDFRSGLNMKYDLPEEVTCINIHVSHKSSKHGMIQISQHQNIIDKHPTFNIGQCVD